MPRPAYPPDWSSTVRGLQQGVRAAYTAAQTRVRYAAIRAASIIIGAQDGNKITIDPQVEGGRAAIFLQTPSGTARGILGITPGADGDGVSTTLRAQLQQGQESSLSVWPHRAGLWVRDPDGATVTTVQANQSSVYAGWSTEADGSRVRLTKDGGYLDFPTGAHGSVYITRAGATLVGYRANGTVAAALHALSDGRIAWSGTWSPPPSTMAARAAPAPVDPGPDAELADQVAHLRAVVDAQGAELAEIRARLDQMPAFERVTAEELADLLDDQAEEGGDR